MNQSSRTLHCGWTKLAVCMGLAILIVGIAGAQPPTGSPAPPPMSPPTVQPGPGTLPPPPPVILDEPPDPSTPDDEPRTKPGLRNKLRKMTKKLAGKEPQFSESKGEPVRQPSAFRAPISIGPKTPARDLLPTPPRSKPQTPSAFVDDLAQVPELMLAEPFGKRPDANKQIEAIAHQIAKINHVNASGKDRFMEVLLAERPDLGGLPFVMGDACRMPLARSRHFTRSAAILRNEINVGGNTTAFLYNWLHQCQADDEGLGRVRPNMEDHVAPARIAAMMQVCSPAAENVRLAMTKYIGSVSREESTHALARIVLFTPEEDIRNAALRALAARKDKDYTDLLLQGFRYPWPAVGKRAADALVKLDRKDLIPQLIDILDEPDPRAPIVKKGDGKSVATVREVVRINHHRNCLMCHAPGQDVPDARLIGGESAIPVPPGVMKISDVLVAEVPVPGQPLPSFQSGGYQSQGLPELLVRIDVTYLRQDFSLMLPVADAAPWPEQQRFDFVTRTRVLNEDELKEYRDRFDNLEPGILPPNHKFALSALRELTGKDTEPTAEAWRKLLNIKTSRDESASKQARRTD